MRQVGIVLVKHILGHAVVAAEIAAVCDADAQIAQRPAQLVGQHGSTLASQRGSQRSGRHGQGRAAQVDQGDNSGRGTFRHGCIVSPALSPVQNPGLKLAHAAETR